MNETVKIDPNTNVINRHQPDPQITASTISVPIFSLQYIRHLTGLTSHHAHPTFLVAKILEYLNAHFTGFQNVFDIESKCLILTKRLSYALLV